MNGLMTGSQNYKRAKPPQSPDENSDTWHSVHSYDRLQAAVIAPTHEPISTPVSAALYPTSVHNAAMTVEAQAYFPPLHVQGGLCQLQSPAAHIFAFFAAADKRAQPIQGVAALQSCLGMFHKQEPFSSSFGRLLFQIVPIWRRSLSNNCKTSATCRDCLEAQKANQCDHSVVYCIYCING